MCRTSFEHPMILAKVGELWTDPRSPEIDECDAPVYLKTTSGSVQLNRCAMQDPVRWVLLSGCSPDALRQLADRMEQGFHGKRWKKETP